MVKEGKGRLFKRKDEKYLIYVPKDLAEDSMFPLRFEGEENSMAISIRFEGDKLIIKRWE